MTARGSVRILVPRSARRVPLPRGPTKCPPTGVRVGAGAAGPAAWSAIRSTAGGDMAEVPVVAIPRSGGAFRAAPSVVRQRPPSADPDRATRERIRASPLALSEARRTWNHGRIGLSPPFTANARGRDVGAGCPSSPRHTEGRPTSSSSRPPTSTAASWSEPPTGSSSSSRGHAVRHRRRKRAEAHAVAPRSGGSHSDDRDRDRDQDPTSACSDRERESASGWSCSPRSCSGSGTT